MIGDSHYRIGGGRLASGAGRFVERSRHKGHYQSGPGPAGADGGVAGAERATRTASLIPPPGQSSTAILRRRPRGSQDASCRGRVQPRDWDRLRMGGGGSAQVGRRRGRPRRVRWVEQAPGREDLADHGRVLHRGDEPQPAAAARACEHVDPEGPAHQGGPGPGARAA
jgi:hypothetical protein